MMLLIYDKVVDAQVDKQLLYCRINELVDTIRRRDVRIFYSELVL